MKMTKMSMREPGATNCQTDGSRKRNSIENARNKPCLLSDYRYLSKENRGIRGIPSLSYSRILNYI